MTIKAPANNFVIDYEEPVTPPSVVTQIEDKNLKGVPKRTEFAA